MIQQEAGTVRWNSKIILQNRSKRKTRIVKRNKKVLTCHIDVHVYLLLCSHHFLGLDLSGVVIFAAVGFHRFCDFDIFQFIFGVFDLCFGLLNTLGLPKREHEVSHDGSRLFVRGGKKGGGDSDTAG